MIAHRRQWGWRFVDELCWRKTDNGVPGGWGNRFKNAWEPVFHFTRSETIKFRPRAVSHESDDCFAYSPNNPKSTSGSGLLGTGKRGDKARGGMANDGVIGAAMRQTRHSDEQGRFEGWARPSNVIEVRSESTQGSHSAPFPRALVEFFIKAFTDPGDVVFDPFLGSGTTMAAALCARAVLLWLRDLAGILRRHRASDRGARQRLLPAARRRSPVRPGRGGARDRGGGMTIGATELAGALGISRQRVYAMVREGKIRRERDGKFDLAKVQAALAANLDTRQNAPSRDEPAAAAPRANGAPLQFPQPQAPVKGTLAHAQLMHEQAKAAEAAMRAQRLEGRLADVGKLNAWAAGMIVRARDILLRVGPELQDRLAQTSDPQACGALVTNEIVRALQQLSEYRDAA